MLPSHKQPGTTAAAALLIAQVTKSPSSKQSALLHKQTSAMLPSHKQPRTTAAALLIVQVT
jgi:hypothetical protein